MGTTFNFWSREGTQKNKAQFRDFHDKSGPGISWGLKNPG